MLFCASSYCQGNATDSVEFRQREFVPTPEAKAAAPTAYSASVEAGSMPQTSVSLYTGTPDISIPIHTMTLGNYSLPLTLCYRSSGIKVAQEATNVGLGWSLLTGGVITRTIKDMDDLKYPLVHPDSVQGKLASYEENTPRDYDCEYDEFMYNMNGYSGRFFIKKQYNDTVTSHFDSFFLESPSHNLKITYSNQTFEIRTSDNILYTFGARETKQKWWAIGKQGGKVTNICGVKQGSNAPMISTLYETVPESFDSNSETTTAWYITKITLPSGEEIEFFYQDLLNPYLSPMFYSKRYIKSIGTVSNSNIANPNPDARVESTERIEIERIHRQPRLNQIHSNGGTVRFDYEVNKREDIRTYGVPPTLPGALKHIWTYNSSNRILRKFRFKYSYFIGKDANGTNAEVTESDAYLRKRLKLCQLAQYYGTDSLFYNMSYDESDSLPVKNTLYTDKWGYYAGSASQDCPYDPYVAGSPIYRYLRLDVTGNNIMETHNIHQPALATGQVSMPEDHPAFPKPGAAAGIWMLTSYTTPLGGNTQIQYEPNTVFSGREEFINEGNISTNTYTASSTITNTSEGNFLLLKCTYSGANILHFPLYNNGLLVTAPYSYVNNEPLYEQDWWTKEQGRTMLSVSGGGSLQISGFPGDAVYSSDALHEYYTFSRRIPITPSSTINLTISPSQNATLHVEATICKGHYETLNDTVGGMRVARIVSPTGTKSFLYSGSNGYSSGKLARMPKFSDYKQSVHGPGPAYRITQYVEFNTSPYRSMTNPFTGHSVGYSEVRTIQHSGIDSIVQVDYFHNETEGSLTYNSLDTPLPLNGKVRMHDVLSNGRVVNGVKYGYGNSPLLLPIPSFSVAAGKKKYLWHQFSPVMQCDEVERGTDASVDDSILTQTYYTYNSRNFRLASETRQVQGEPALKTEITYKVDYLEPGLAFTEYPVHPHFPLLSPDSIYYNSNLICLPQSKTYYVDNQAQRKVYYVYDGSPQALPVREYSFLLRPGVSIPDADSISSSYGALPDYQYMYNRMGRLVNSVSRAGFSTVYLWGYYNQHIVAVIENATLAQVENCGIDIDELAEQRFPSSNYKVIMSNLQSQLPYSRVTIREYIPSVGVSYEADPNGVVKRYVYDSFNRLTEIREQIGNSTHVIQKKTYQYATE